MTISTLAARLAEPGPELPLDRLPGSWFHSVILMRCRAAGRLAGDGALPGKIRGAWGRCLTETASAEAIGGEACPWSPPSALDVFMRCQGWITPAMEIPKPYAFALAAAGEDLVVRLTLFGFATDWTEMAAEALVRALRGPLSIGRSLDVIDRRYWSEEGLACQADATTAAIRFETPLQIRQGDRTVEPDLPTLVSSLGNRISGLARWQDAAVQADWRGLKAHAAGLDVAMAEGDVQDWTRYSRRQNRPIPMQGSRPCWLIQGDLAPLMPLLVIGATTHAGGRASLGMGRYALEIAGPSSAS